MKYEEEIQDMLKKAESRAWSDQFISANQKLIDSGMTNEEMFALVIDLNMHLQRNGKQIRQGVITKWMAKRKEIIQLFEHFKSKNL
jgi:hypothetical protein